MTEEIEVLREQVNENNLIIRSLLRKILMAKICLKIVLIIKSRSVNVKMVQ